MCVFIFVLSKDCTMRLSYMPLSTTFHLSIAGHHSVLQGKDLHHSSNVIYGLVTPLVNTKRGQNLKITITIGTHSFLVQGDR